MFLDVKPLHQKPPRNPAWIAAVILIVISLGVLAFFKLRAHKASPAPDPNVETVPEEAFPPAVPLEPVDIRSVEEAATFSLSPVTRSNDVSIAPPQPAPAPASPDLPRLELPTDRLSAAGVVTPAPASPAGSDLGEPSAPVVSTVVSAPRVPGMLTARMSGEEAGAAPSIDTSMSAEEINAPPPTASSATPTTPPSEVRPSTAEVARTAVNRPTRPVTDTFEAQLALDQAGFSPGSIDGVYGNQTRQALLAFQQKERLSMTGRLDAETKSRLRLIGEPHRYHTVTEIELAGLAPVPESWTDRSRRTRLGYESILELVAEKSHASPAFITLLNPGVNWSSVTAGSRVRVPNAAPIPSIGEKAAFLRIRLSEKTVHAFDQNNRIVAHFPCSIAANFANRPQGQLKVTVLVEGPNYTFDPKRFPNTPEAKFMVTKLILPPGPNNPVGAAWIGLDAPGYGIHGTPEPEKIGKTGSLGCFRLANWNAKRLIKMAWIGMPVHVVQ